MSRLTDVPAQAEDEDFGRRRDPLPMTDEEIAERRRHVRKHQYAHPGIAECGDVAHYDARWLATVDALRATIEEKERATRQLDSMLTMQANVVSDLRAEIERLKAAARDHEECIGELEYAAENAALKAEMNELTRNLNDPATVHMNILRGTIALTREQALHIACATDYDTLKAENAELRAQYEPLTYANRFMHGEFNHTPRCTSGGCKE